jgi:hypothetical protein
MKKALKALFTKTFKAFSVRRVDWIRTSDPPDIPCRDALPGCTTIIKGYK